MQVSRIRNIVGGTLAFLGVVLTMNEGETPWFPWINLVGLGLFVGGLSLVRFE